MIAGWESLAYTSVGSTPVRFAVCLGSARVMRQISCYLTTSGPEARS